jgi:hypothetical protein
VNSGWVLQRLQQVRDAAVAEFCERFDAAGRALRATCRGDVPTKYWNALIAVNRDDPTGQVLNGARRAHAPSLTAKTNWG